MHPWVGAGEEDVRRILKEIGKSSVDELFDAVPDEVSIDSLPMADAADEATVLKHFRAMADRNTPLAARPSFLGSGVYRHVRPAVVDATLSRAEFFTSYTPYQPEISQGTVQVIFEFQTIMCDLTGLEVANASLYDGATALTEAALFCHRVLRGKKSRVVVAETVHPMYRSVLDTYTAALGIEVVVVAPEEDGRLSPEAVAAAADGACAVAVQSPNFLGVVEDLAPLAEAAHSAGALAVHVVAEAVSLALLEGGGSLGFDVVCGEAQSFGVPVGFGGPHLGFFACSAKNVRQMPGRLAGETVDEDGQRAFCLTLSTREQHIRRAKATSNICTNQGLMALAATVWLETLGGAGLRELALSCLSRAHELKRRVEASDGWKVAYPSSPIFNEVLIQGPAGGEELARRLAGEGILSGLPSQRFAGSWPDGLIMAVTELTSAADLDALTAAMRRLS